MKTIIEVNNLDFSYGDNAILENLTFSLTCQKFLGIIGPNGAGKSTLLKLLTRLIMPLKGLIQIDSKPIEQYSIRDLAKKIAVVRPEFIPVFDFTVRQIVSMARTPHISALGFESNEDKKIINESLELTETLKYAHRSLAELSSGERQRVFIARALAQNTDILLLDEPTAFLDLRHQVAIYDLLKQLQLEMGKTIVMVSHDINMTAQYVDQVLILGSDGHFHNGNTQEVLKKEIIEEIFQISTIEFLEKNRKFYLPLGKFNQNHTSP